MSQNVPYVYIFLYSKFKKECILYPYITHRQVVTIIKRVIRIPYFMIEPVLYQMEEHRLIKRINQRKLRLLKFDADKIINRLGNYLFWYKK